MKIETRQDPDGYWVAFDSDEYEAECDTEGYWHVRPIGYGKTPQLAILELMEETARRDVFDKDVNR